MVNVMILIPAYNPDSKLVYLVDELVASNFSKILVINDGSSASCNDLFTTIAAKAGVVVIKHEQNRGKGCAIKTGLAWYREHTTGLDGVVTADADGQHLVEDIMQVALLTSKTGKLVLGTRSFGGKGVPLKSYIGNKLTVAIFKLVSGHLINDTQTGLRGLPHAQTVVYENLSGDRYEYETEMLLSAAMGSGVTEVAIKTVYENNNKGSHFNPIVDSFKIYRILVRRGSRRFLQYSMVSLSSFVIDIVLFFIFAKILLPGVTTSIVGVATICSRAISATYNFTMNRLVVFKSKSSLMHDMLRYVVLAIFIMGNSYLFVKLANEWLLVDPVVAKVFVDSIIFIVSFFLQRLFVFMRHSSVK